MRKATGLVVPWAVEHLKVYQKLFSLLVGRWIYNQKRLVYPTVIAPIPFDQPHQLSNLVEGGSFSSSSGECFG